MEQEEDPVHRDVALARYLREHHGAIGVRDLRALGFDGSAVRRLLGRERLLREHRGVYRIGDAQPTNRMLLQCALLAAGSGGAISRASAAHLLGLIQFEPKVISVAVPRRSIRRPGLDIHSVKYLPPRHVKRVERIDCTTPFRTVLDLAAVTRTSAEYKLLRRALRQGAVKDKRLAARLADVLEASKGFRGSRILAELVDEHVPGAVLSRSELEEAFLDLCREGGLPIPETNTMVEGCEVDVLWRFERVVAELDTYDYHGDVLSFERDRERDTHLTVAGYRPIRITPRRIQGEPEKLLRQTGILLGLPHPARLGRRQG
ncbi:MAG: type IV toxin-antitoxin system AbiEi family antitoxin domain-containing protein [Solirubrobacteraceae bacterium]|nr:hypothetical protein [Patulibacter sp.]